MIKAGGYSHSEFYQFKRCSFHRKPYIGNEYCLSDYYAFSVYNRPRPSERLGQFDMLCKLCRECSAEDLVCYAVPAFHTQSQYLNHINSLQILQNSVIIPFGQFAEKPIRLEKIYHKIRFKKIEDRVGGQSGFRYEGLLCSDPVSITLYPAKQMLSERAVYQRDFSETVNMVRNILSEDHNKNTLDNPGLEFMQLQWTLMAYHNIVWVPVFIRSISSLAPRI